MAADRSVTDAVLDAAETCYDRAGSAKPTMETVAAVAGVSRAYLYKHFGNRDGLTLALLERRADAFNDRARGLINAQATLADAVVEGIMFGVKMACRDPYFGRLVGAATADPEHRIPGALAAAEQKTADLWRPLLEDARARGELPREVVIDDVIDWLRIVLLGLLANRQSFGTADDVLERQLRTLLVPAITTQSCASCRSC